MAFLLNLLLILSATSLAKTDYTKHIKEFRVTAEPCEESVGAIGQGFELRKEDLLTKQFKATGSKIFEEFPIDECTKTDVIGTIENGFESFRDSASLYRWVADRFKIEKSLIGAYTLGVSVGAINHNLASAEKEVNGIVIYLNARSMSTEITQSCLNKQPLASQLISDFESLDKEIKNPSKISSWQKYKVFLKKYGTHIVKETISGASVGQYTFSSSKQETLFPILHTVSACVSLAGSRETDKVRNVGLPMCSEITQELIEFAVQFSFVHKLAVKGGKMETRAKLSHSHDRDSVVKFIMEAGTHPTPIEYKFNSIWSFLKARYIGTEHFAKAINLEQFYKGYLHFGCSFQYTTDSGGKEVQIQKFVLSQESDPESPSYECKIAEEGCHHHDDCHYRATHWCECGGADSYSRSCLRHKEKQLASGTIKKESYVNKESNFAWHGCSLHRGHLLSCWCKAPGSKWEDTWTWEHRNDALNDVHSILKEKLSSKRKLL